MSNVIYGNMVGGGSAPLKTLILTDENGNEVVGVVTESVQMFDATPADVKINKTFVSDNGIETGENTITYRTTKGFSLVLPGDNFSITDLSDYKQYDYTELQCIICKFNTTLNNSTCAVKISLNNQVFPVNSVDAESNITKNSSLGTIDLNIKNDGEDIYIIHYFTYREDV